MQALLRWILLCSIAPLCACAVHQETGPIEGSPALVVASDLDNPPFAEIDGEGRCRGREVDMMERIAAELRRPIEWRRLPFAELIPAAERGEVDVVCASLGVTPERAQRVAFTTPYFETEIAVVVRSGVNEPHTLGDLAGRKVAAGSGTTSERAVSLRLPRSTGLFDDEPDEKKLDRLLAHDIDAAVLDAPGAEALVAESRGTLVRLPEGLGDERYALALSKKSDDLLSSINRCLLRMDQAGTLREIYATFHPGRGIVAGGSR